MTVTTEDAAARRWVALPDGRTGRLVSVPAGARATARVQFDDGGPVVDVPADRLTLVKRKGHSGKRGGRRRTTGWAQLMPIDDTPRLPDGTVDVRALCRQWDAHCNEGLGQ